MIGSRAYLVLAAVLFGTGGTAIKLSSLSVWQLAGLRSAIAAVVLGALIPAWRGFNPRSLLVGVAFAATMILFVTANTLTTAASAIFLQTTAPLYVLLLGPLLLGEAVRRTDLPVVGLFALGATLFFVAGETPLPTAPNPAAGNAIAAVSGLAWALTVVGLRWLGRRPRVNGRDPTGNAVLLGSGLVLGICLPFMWPLGGATAIDWAVVGYLGVFQIGLAYACLVRGVRGARALDVALIMVLEPVASTLLAWGVLGEVPGEWAAAGSAVILFGLLLQAARAGEGGAPTRARTN